MGAIKDGKVVINAVHDRDAEQMWKRLKLSSVEQCVICNADVTWNTFSAIIPVDGKVKVACDKGVCFYEASKLKR